MVALASAPGEVDLVAATAVAAAGPNHAAVIVDTGQTVKKVCVTFDEDAISGAEALRRAKVDAVFDSYGANGEGVCAICGVGCPAGNCFCDRSRFWAYHRAGPGGGYAFSRVGASSTTVRDGDVEGWRWGTGAAPPYASVGEVCGVAEATPGTQPPPPTTLVPAPADPPAVAPAPEPTPPAGEPPPAATSTKLPAPATPGPPPPPVPEGSSVTSAPGALDTPAELEEPGDERSSETADETPAGEQAGPVTRSAADRRTAQKGPPTPVSLAAFVLVLGGLVGWRWRLRRNAQVRRTSGVG